MKLIVSTLCSLMLLLGSPFSFAETSSGNSATTTPPEQMEKPHATHQNSKQHSPDGATTGSENDIQKLKKKSETESKANKSRDMQKESSGGSY
ncbi:hypothetical protein [Methylovorus mays]|uniref:hypothetical protein n=1 Tax=Methylovorus mays TaxID=184077 RepID=UPI001E2DF348|nr:hypothetical protein [Methylovorus mays]MCB5206671.1 hypothetical protein [Methylovorus mays]